MFWLCGVLLIVGFGLFVGVCVCECLFVVDFLCCLFVFLVGFFGVWGGVCV